MNRLRIVLLSSLSLTVLACGDSKGNADTTSTETGSGDGDGDNTASNGDGDGTPGDGDGTPGDGDGDGTPGDGDGDGDGAPAECGNGVIDPGEECDDGVDNNGDTFACLSDCKINICGDGFEGPNEGCDDGNTVSGDGCSDMCLLENVDPEATLCGNKLYQCGDTIDNDMDGKIDLADPECIGPCDDDEGTFQTNLPGQNQDCKGDCYFDDNSGGGDDHCEWNLICDPQNPGADIGCAYDPGYMMCDMMMPQDCLDFCEPLVPNGCDCFGCCDINGQFVYLGGGMCSLDNLDACPSCTYFENCGNPCMPDLCELCFGQTPDDLPPECMEPSCPDNVQSCTDSSQCQLGFYCQTGCCIPIMPG